MCAPVITNLPTHESIEDEAHEIRDILRKIRSQLSSQKFPTYQPWEAEAVITGRLQQFLDDQKKILKQYGDAVDAYYSNQTIAGFALFQQQIQEIWQKIDQLKAFAHYSNGKDE